MLKIQKIESMSKYDASFLAFTLLCVRASEKIGPVLAVAHTKLRTRIWTVATEYLALTQGFIMTDQKRMDLGLILHPYSSCKFHKIQTYATYLIPKNVFIFIVMCHALGASCKTKIFTRCKTMSL